MTMQKISDCDTEATKTSSTNKWQQFSLAIASFLQQPAGNNPQQKEQQLPTNENQQAWTANVINK